jgi:hypothetical protein
MKTFSVLLLALAASGVATLAGGFAAGATLLFASAFAAIVALDYTRGARVLKLPATVALGARMEKFGLAA